ncbi:MAG: HAMP domain-containing sensor histidine kinase, partial [Acidobacteriota bacterium]
LLAGLQYRWLSQINDSDREKAHKHVQEQAERFGMDFNREIQNVYFNFQTDASVWKERNWDSFNERYDYWREKASYPDLITDIYFFEAKPDVQPLRYDRTSRSFVPTEVTVELADLRARFSDEKTFKPIYEDSLSLVLPIREPEPTIGPNLMRKRTPEPEWNVNPAPKYGYLAINLDPATIKDKILPDLTAKYFGDADFRTAVVDKGGQRIFQAIDGDKSDATSPLLDLSPDNYIFFANKELMSSIGQDRHAGEKHAGTVVSSRVESHTLNRFQTTGDNGSTIKLEVKTDSKPRTSVFTSTTPGDNNAPWTLEVQHASGSLDTYLANTLRRNLAVGFGLLFLLAAAIAAIIISAQRAKMFAQRQVDFVSSVSHEFRTPLAVIYSAGENLADGVAKENEQVFRYGNLIKGEGKKLTGMVEQILDFAGANSGRKKYNFERTAVGEVVANAIAECRPIIDDKKIEIEAEISSSLLFIDADGPALSQAIQNLIVNSVKYSNGKKWLRVTAGNGGGRVRISVADRGIGISKGDLRQIFEPFYRSKDVVDAQIHGNGLGLSLVKQIIEAHGGKVIAESEPGKGSTFTIELPLK